MRHRGRLLTTLIIIGILSSVVLPSVNAEVFDIGTKVSESDLDTRGKKLVYFDSETTVYVEADYIDYIASIFDGDESTGIDHDFGPGHDLVQIELMFPSALYISSITIKPTFGGGTTNYTLEIDTPLVFGPSFAYDISTEESFQINCKITGIILVLYSGGTHHFYFNDVIIDYTPGVSNHDEPQDQIEDNDGELDNSLVYAALTLAIIGILIALTSIILLYNKIGTLMMPPKKEETKDIITTGKKINEFKK